MPRPTRSAYASFVVAAGTLLVAGTAARSDRVHPRPRLGISALRIPEAESAPLVGDREDRHVSVEFLYTGPRRVRIPVVFEVGVDRDGDGAVEPGEFRPATVDRDAEGSTSLRRVRRRRPHLHYFQSGREGRLHTARWRPWADLGRDRWLAERPVAILDGPPGAVATVPGPRAVFRVRTRRTDVPPADVEFEYDGDTAPATSLELLLDASRPWVSFGVRDEDAEDGNRNGALDAEEDADRDGVLDVEPVTVRLWWSRVPEGWSLPWDPAALEALRWTPCTAEAVPVQSPRESVLVAPTWGGSFFWDVAADAPGEPGPFLVGVAAFDGGLKTGGLTVLPEPIVLPR